MTAAICTHGSTPQRLTDLARLLEEEALYA
jgi:hypothetical protein